jgi:transposase
MLLTGLCESARLSFSEIHGFSFHSSTFRPLHLLLARPPPMKWSPPEWKHFILTQYRPRQHGSGFDALARRYGVVGGGRTIKDWYDRWDGMVESLRRKAGAGRPRQLSSSEVQQYIIAPIREKNRRSHAVRYTDLLQPLQQKTGKKVSLRTIQRYGKKSGGIKSKRTIKKTKWECKFLKHNHIHAPDLCILLGSSLISGTAFVFLS